MNVSLLAYTRGINGESPEELALLIAQVPYKTKSKNSLKAALDCGHLSILEHLSFTFRIEDLSRVSQQQLTRHRIASYTIQSDRHTRRDGMVTPATVTTAHAVSQPSGTDEIEKLALLRDKGTLTEEEFQAKKRQLLGR
jgi:thymidylate synthase ThyX